MGRSLVLVILTVSLLVGPALGQNLAARDEGFKIGFIDAQKVLENSKLGKKANTKMDEYRKSREKILELEQKDLKGLEETLAKQSGLLSPEARRDKEEEFQRKVERFQRKLLEVNREIQDKQVELIREFRAELEKAVKKIAQSEGYDFVLDWNTEVGNILYAKESFDLTEVAILELDQTAK